MIMTGIEVLTIKTPLDSNRLQSKVMSFPVSATFKQVLSNNYFMTGLLHWILIWTIQLENILFLGC